ncbi:MAG: hypothetical protein EA352_11460 [Gemmatimonadales bacterium]|nr:MAG: hypothetical protein EA352_11460 [Gemmatimonadales bacterium]
MTDRSRRIPIRYVLFGLVLLVAVGFEFVGDPTPREQIWDEVLFFGVWGFLGCLVLSLLAKGIVSPGLDRPEDYYAPEEARHDWSTESPVTAPPARRNGEG